MAKIKLKSKKKVVYIEHSLPANATPEWVKEMTHGDMISLINQVMEINDCAYDVALYTVMKVLHKATVEGNAYLDAELPELRIKVKRNAHSE
jgi:hypothetical protein